MKKLASLLLIICAFTSVAQETKPFRNDEGLYGLKTEDGNTVVEAKYEVIHYCGVDGWFIFSAKENGARREGIMNAKGEILLPAKYVDIGHFKDGHSIIKEAIKEDKIMYVVKYQYGIMNSNFEIVLKPQYQNIKAVPKANTFIVKKDDKCGMIDISGKVLIDPSYDNLTGTGYSEYDYIIAHKDDKYGLINIAGKVVIAPKYEKGKAEVNDAGWCVMYNGKWGMVDFNDKKLIDFKYDDIRVIKHSYHTENDKIYARVKNGKLYGAVDEKGNEIVPFEYQHIGYYSEDYIVVKKGGKYGYIDGQGNVKIEPQFKDASNFKQALAPAKLKKKWGYINNLGKWAIEPQYDEAESFHNGVARVEVGKEYFFIDPTGKRVRR